MTQRMITIGWVLLVCAVLQSQGARLNRHEFPAAGRNQTILVIDAFGRYRIGAESAQGVALEVVDRMVGPIGSDGHVGHRDGQIDLLLEPGEYLVRLEGHESASGKVSLSVKPFRDRGTESLVYGQLVESQLDDLEQISFWVYLDRNPFYLEAMGRYLKDCRLWLGGNWSAPAHPTLTIFEPQPGMPMVHAEFHHELPKGWYKLTLYGGPPQPWSVSSSTQPLWLQLGVTHLAQSGRQDIEMSPFGRVSFLAEKDTNTFFLSRSEKKKTLLRRTRWIRGKSRYLNGVSTSIEKNSRNPWCQIEGTSGTDFQWITVTAEPGAALTLDYLVQRRSYSLPAENTSYLVTSHHGRTGGPSLDVTGIMTHPDFKEPVFSQVVHLGPEQPYERVFNLDQQMDVFIMVEQTGAYVLEEFPGQTGSGRYRFERFAVDRPYDYQPPQFKSPNRVFNLARGIHVLTIDSLTRGSVHLRVMAQESSAVSKPTPIRNALLFPGVVVTQRDAPYVLWMNHRGNIPCGLDIRKTPVDLSRKVSFVMSMNEEVIFPISIERRSKLIQSNDAVATSFLDSDLDPGLPLEPGEHVLVLKNTEPFESTCHLSLIEMPLSRAPLAEPEDVSRFLPRLEIDKSVFRDFSRRESQYFLLEVEKPGLYRIETSGRLATSVILRSRLDTAIVEEKSNGIGRNALIQPYLKSGEYLVMVTVLGESQGRLGIHFSQGQLIDGPSLLEGQVEKTTLPRDAAVRFPVEISEKGEYRLTTYGVGRRFAHRLEDADGWPLMKPGGQEDIVRQFENGVYYLTSLAEPSESKRLTLLQQNVIPPPLDGKGPHQIDWNVVYQNLWRTGEPDRFLFEVPAELDVEIEVSKGMKATLLLQEKTVDVFPGGETWRGFLKTGQYALELVRGDEDDRFPYNISIGTQTLATGIDQIVSALPAELILSVDSDGLYDISSFGITDIRAQLVDETGQVLAENDDARDDWNIQFSEFLSPGKMRVLISEMSKLKETIRFSVKERPREIVPQRDLPFSWKSEAGNGLLEIPVKIDKAGLVWFSTKEDEDIVISVSDEQRFLGQTRGEMWIPMKAGKTYLLRLFRLNQSKQPIHLFGETVDVESHQLGDRKLPLRPLRVLELNDSEQRSFDLDLKGGLVANRWEQPLVPRLSGLINLQSSMAWIMVKSEPGFISPFVLSSDGFDELVVGQLPWDFGVEPKASGPHLMEIQSAGGYFGASVRHVDSKVPNSGLWAGMHAQECLTVVAIPPMSRLDSSGQHPELSGRIWNVEADRGPRKVQVKLTPLNLVEPPITLGEECPLVSIDEAVEVLLGPPPNHLELWLSRGLIAFCWHDEHSLMVCAAQHGHRHVTTTIESGRLFVANRSSSEGLFRISTCEPDDVKKPILIDAGFGSEINCIVSETFRYQVHANPESWFYVQGQDARASFYRNDGILEKTPPFLLNDSGMVEIQANRGIFRAWVSDEQGDTKGLFGPKPELPPRPLDSPWTDLAPHGEIWVMNVEKPALLVLNFDNPGATALVKEDRVFAVSLGMSGKERRIIRYLQKGTYEIWTRPLRGQTSGGKMRWSIIEPIPVMQDGDENKRLISDGEFHVYCFEVRTTRPIGVGIRADEERCRVDLYSESYEHVAQGTGMFEELSPGLYLIVVEGNGPPVLYRPVVLGLKDEMEIPQEVREKFETGGRP